MRIGCREHSMEPRERTRFEKSPRYFSAALAAAAALGTGAADAQSLRGGWNLETTPPPSAGATPYEIQQAGICYANLLAKGKPPKELLLPCTGAEGALASEALVSQLQGMPGINCARVTVNYQRKVHGRTLPPATLFRLGHQGSKGECIVSSTKEGRRHAGVNNADHGAQKKDIPY